MGSRVTKVAFRPLLASGATAFLMLLRPARGQASLVTFRSLGPPRPILAPFQSSKADSDASRTWPTQRRGLRQFRQHRLHERASFGLMVRSSNHELIDPRPIAGTATDGADVTDGIFTIRAHPYHSGPAPALTRERDLNTHRPEECLRPSRATGECARVFCRAARRDLIAGILLSSKY